MLNAVNARSQLQRFKQDAGEARDITYVFGGDESDNNDRGRKQRAACDSAGRPNVIQDRCPHRGASLSLGKIRDKGLSCPYHGWTFDSAGTCIEIPFGDGQDDKRAATMRAPNRYPKIRSREALYRAAMVQRLRENGLSEKEIAGRAPLRGPEVVAKTTPRLAFSSSVRGSGELDLLDGGGGRGTGIQHSPGSPAQSSEPWRNLANTPYPSGYREVTRQLSLEFGEIARDHRHVKASEDRLLRLAV
jgi:nitrite reductase/ring-hydroxylating ferredoxin subunit